MQETPPYRTAGLVVLVVAAIITTSDLIDVTSVSTEFNTLFETVVSVAEQVDPIKLNQTLAATAEALDGLGDRFGQSIVHGNAILADSIRRCPRFVATTSCWPTSERHTPTPLLICSTACKTRPPPRPLNEQQGNIDQALMAAVGFGNTGGEVFERGGPYLVRGARDQVSTSQVLDRNSPALYCTIRNFHDAEPLASRVLGGNGYSSNGRTMVVGPGNPYVYPDNLPRVNAKGGPEGKPGCWQPVTRDLWPAPYLVMDTGASIAP
jgi:phospholipid/cholesterol/gamma-HCH transport system substrate-binding protein